MHYHKGLGQKAGLSDAQIRDLDRFEQSSAYGDLEKLVLRFADEWTRQGKASAEVVQKLTKTLSPAQMVVLAGSVGLANWTNRFNETFAVELP
jgi:alkylhydroperoxidase family enzyme